MATILIVDDEAPHLRTLAKVFKRERYDVVLAATGTEALEKLREHDVHLVVTDLMMPGLDGLELLKVVRTVSPETEVILMSAFGTVEKAVEAMKEGAYDFVVKPIKRAELVKSARQALDRQALVAENRSLKAQLAGYHAERSIIGSSPALREVIEMVKQVANSRATALFTGESGTGKELFSRAIHDFSDRRGGPFVAVNCAALPESIIEAELFGTEKGAFTGSTKRAGRFEAAGGGTLLLDEVGELPATAQVKLLRVLQDGEIVRLGSNKPVKVDVRIVAATNKDLNEEVESGRFREDLYYRLNVITITLPPLRARPNDIPLLSNHFLKIFAVRDKREHVLPLSRAAEDALVRYSWPGNVRELQNIMERAVVLDKDGRVDIDDLPDTVANSTREARHLNIPLGMPLAEVERRVIQETLRMTQGDKKLAAQLLGIATRTIYRKL